jgi:hypothetical protein
MERANVVTRPNISPATPITVRKATMPLEWEMRTDTWPLKSLRDYVLHAKSQSVVGGLASGGLARISTDVFLIGLRVTPEISRQMFANICAGIELHEFRCTRL